MIFGTDCSIAITNMSKAILVFGPESSGTRVMTRLFINSGFYGQDNHSQNVDAHLDAVKLPQFIEKNDIQNIVFRRSIPHGGGHPDLSFLFSLFNMYFDDTRVVVTMRSFPTSALSQLNKMHSGDIDGAYKKIADAYLRIFDFLNHTGARYHIVEFGSLCNYPKTTLHCMAKRLGVSMNVDELAKIVNSNIESDRAKGYRERFANDT